MELDATTRRLQASSFVAVVAGWLRWPWLGIRAQPQSWRRTSTTNDRQTDKTSSRSGRPAQDAFESTTFQTSKEKSSILQKINFEMGSIHHSWGDR
ncbi:hypothetical protein BKA80DRAFT_263256 [Phyllosticta citrichinensis]